jgi:hypothetical protein
MTQIFLPPEEDVVRAITEAHWDKKHNRWSKSIFYTENVSVSRLAISPIDILIGLFNNNFPTMLKVGQINVGKLEELGQNHATPQVIKVVEAPRDDNPAHAIIPGQMSKGLAKTVVSNLFFHDIPSTEA